MALIETTSTGFRFERGGGGLGLVLVVIVMALSSISLGFKTYDMGGAPAAGLSLVVCTGLTVLAVKGVLAIPVRFVQVDVPRRTLRIGVNRRGLRSVEAELHLDSVKEFRGLDRGGGGASWTLTASVFDGADLPRYFAQRVDPAGSIDLLAWTQESRATVQRLLEILRRHGFPVDMTHVGGKRYPSRFLEAASPVPSKRTTRSDSSRATAPGPSQSAGCSASSRRLESKARRPSQRVLAAGSTTRPPAGPGESLALVLETYESLDLELLADALQAPLGLLRQDAIQRARKARGIVAERLTSTQADAVARELGANGIQTRVVPQEQIVRIEKPVLVKFLQPNPDGLHVQLGYSSSSRIVPWERVKLISAGKIRAAREGVGHRPRRKRLSVFGRGVDMGAFLGAPVWDRPGPSASRADRAVELADVFVDESNGAYLHVRLRNRDLYYAAILEEEATSDFKTDFRRLLAKVVARADHAVWNPGLDVMLGEPGAEGLDPADADFGQEDEFTSYTRWLLQVASLEH